ncbi:MAG TPA: ribonuclease R [Gemmatimonadota bacterium]|nr:ribonuclease R [Gemmatimonadota bacterium]
MSRTPASDIGIEGRILDHLAQDAKRPLKLKEIARGLEIDDAGYPRLKEALARLTDEGRIYRIKHQRYALPEQISLVVGRIDATRSGSGFVVPDQKTGEPDIFVPQHKLAGATHRDRVVARIEGRRDGRPDGRVIRVLERARSEVVGTLQRSKHFGFVVPDNPRLKFDVYVAQEDLNQAKEGQKVVVAIDEWGDGAKNPEGRVTDVLGYPDDPGIDILSIVVSHGLDPEFPPEVESAAGGQRSDIEAEARRRTDFRDRACFTIDPTDARDFDDALSIRQLEGGFYEIGIHIADVSHYVEPDGPIDEEAAERGTSAYLVDRVIPMLPEKLSNDLCSLVPGEDRLTYSVILTMDAEAEVKEYAIRETVIRSRFRLTYAQAQSLIRGEPEVAEHKSILFDIQTLRRLAKLLRAKRFQRGSLDFDLPEAIVELDEEGFPIDIKESVRLDSMRLIEEFMLLANETVARHVSRRNVPFLYRVHDTPSAEKIERIREFVGALGYQLPKPKGSLDPQRFADILRQAKGKREEELINTVILRSMMQARYQVENIGHFGLASDHYTHFTSPIRRYPDLIVHRIVKRLENGERWKDSGARDRQIAKLAHSAEHCSVQERNAAEAERDSIDLKKVEFMERHVGDEFDGKISGVTAFGFFVRLDTHFVEGLVHVNELEDDYYEFHEGQYALVGRNTGRRFRLADPVRVRVENVDKGERKIDFELIEKKDKGSKKEKG